MDNLPMQQAALHQAMIVPAVSPQIEGKQPYFLFGVLQVESLLQEVSVRSVPFSAPHLDGVAEWREHILPVISLERYLGLSSTATPEANRFLLVRVPSPSGRTGEIIRGILRVHPHVRKMYLAPDCPADRSGAGCDPDRLLKGVYDWDEKRLLIVDLKRLLWGDASATAEDDRGEAGSADSPPFLGSSREMLEKDRDGMESPNVS